MLDAWDFARVELNLTDGEFFDLTPHRFSRLVAAWSRKQEREDRRFALIACILANTNRKPDSPPFELADFMPMTKEQATERQRKREAAEERAAQYGLASALGAIAKPAVKKTANG